MTFIAALAAAGPKSRGRTSRPTMAGILVATVVAMFVLPSSAAGAQGIDSARSGVTALQAQIDAGASKIHQLTSAYQEANLQAATLAQQLAGDQASLASLRSQVASRSASLRQVALRSYTAGTSGPPDGAASTNPGVAQEYLTVASGNVRDGLDQLSLAKTRLDVAETTLRAEQQAAARAVATAAADRASALADASAEQSRLAGLQAHLQALVTAQAAARSTARSTARQAPITQGGPVNGGLVSIVRQVVAPAQPPAPSPPAAAPAGSPVGVVPAPSPTPAAQPATTTTTAPAVPAAATAGGASGVWQRLRQCESGGNYQENSGNGFYGAYQFSASTWADLGFPGRPDQEPPAMQDQAAMILQGRSGWGQWPACSGALGLGS